MSTQSRLRVYLAQKGDSLDVTGRPLPKLTASTRWPRTRTVVIAAVAALIVIGLPMLLLFARSPAPPMVEESPPPQEADELSWSTGVIPGAAIGGNVVEVADGWLFVPREAGAAAWWSRDGETWNKSGILFPPDVSVFAVVSNEHGYMAFDGNPGEFGPTGSLRLWRSDDGTAWVGVDEFLRPPQIQFQEFIVYGRVGDFAASREHMVFVGFLVPQINHDAIAKSLGMAPSEVEAWGEVIDEGPGGEMSGELSLQQNGEVVWQATFEELGFAQELIAQLAGTAPVEFDTWASDDGGRTWLRGDTLPNTGPFQSLAATEDGFALTSWGMGQDFQPGAARQWVSSDGMQWGEAGGEPALWKIEAAADRFLGAALAIPDELWASSTGDSWILAGEDMDGFPEHEAVQFYGGRAGFVLVEEANDLDGTLTWNLLYSADGYTWADVGVSGSLSPPDHAGVELADVNIGDHSIVISERDLDGNLIVHIGVVET